MVKKLGKHTFIKKVECPTCHGTFDTEFEVSGIPDNLVPIQMAKSIRVKEAPQEQKLEQNQLTEGIEQQSKQEDTDRGTYMIDNKNAKGPHKQYIKGKFKNL